MHTYRSFSVTLHQLKGQGLKLRGRAIAERILGQALAGRRQQAVIAHEFVPKTYYRDVPSARARPVKSSARAGLPKIMLICTNSMFGMTPGGGWSNCEEELVGEGKNQWLGARR